MAHGTVACQVTELRLEKHHLSWLTDLLSMRMTS